MGGQEDRLAQSSRIGLRRVENMAKLGKMTLDVRFSYKGSTWSWTDLESPHLEALRPADKK